MVMREFQARMRALQSLEQAQTNNDQLATAVQQQGENYDILAIALTNDINRIRALPTLAQRAELKRTEFLPKWLPFVDKYLADGKVYQNDYFIYCIIYLFDVGEFEQALALADKAIAQNQAMPNQFNSNLPTFVADQIYKWAEKTAETGQSVEPYFSQVLHKVATQWQLHEVVTAKWLKLAAQLLLRNKQTGISHPASVVDPERLILAIKLCNKAFQLNAKAGVKTMIERSLMRLEALKKQGVEIPPVAGLNLEDEVINFDLVIDKLHFCPPKAPQGEDNV